MFESVEEVDQIETEPKNEDAKQVPKMPNGALQNGTSSPDSGHPSSRNFSVTSGVSDGSLSTEDSAAPDATPRPAALPPATQSQVKPPQGAGLTEGVDMQVKDDTKGKEGEVEKALDVTKTEVLADNMIQPLEEANKEENIQPETQEKVEVDVTPADGKIVESQDGKVDIKGKEVSDDVNMTASAESEGELVEQSLQKEDASIDKTAFLKETAATLEDQTPQEVTGGAEKKDHRVSEVEKNLLLSTDISVPRAREAYCASQRDEAQVMTESDESPSAIEMEEIPKANISMVPWSRKGCCEPLSSSEDSAPHMELRPSPEGTESLLSEEPEMESLYPHFDSLAEPARTKSDATSHEPAGTSFSVCAAFF